MIIDAFALAPANVCAYLLPLPFSNGLEYGEATWIRARPHIVAMHEIDSFGEAWTRPSVRGITKRVGRHFGAFELFVTVLRHDRVQLASRFVMPRKILVALARIFVDIK